MKNTLFLLCTGLLTLVSLPSLADNWGTGRTADSWENSNNYRSNDRTNSRTTGYYNRNRHSSGLTLSINLNSNSDRDTYRNRDRQHSRYRRNNYYNDSYNRDYYGYSRSNRMSNSRTNYISGYSRGLYTTGLFGNYSVIPYTPSVSVRNRRYSSNGSSSRIIYSSEPIRSYNRSSTSSGRDSRRSGSGLIRDIDGNCFEFSHDRYGNENRVQVEPQRCDF